MSEIKHARALLDLAEKDFKALRGMGDALIFAEEVFGFHAQQAVEKTLKAWLAALGLEYPLTHNLARLLALLEKQGAGVDEFWDLTEYTAYAVEYRYGALVMAEEPLDRPAVIRQLQELLHRVQGILAQVLEESSSSTTPS
jgi:HEPN domain-containing protein